MYHTCFLTRKWILLPATKGEGQQNDIIFKKSYLYRDDSKDKMCNMKQEAEVTICMLAKHKPSEPWHDMQKEGDGQFSKKNIFLLASMQNCNFPRNKQEKFGQVEAYSRFASICCTSPFKKPSAFTRSSREWFCFAGSCVCAHGGEKVTTTIAGRWKIQLSKWSGHNHVTELCKGHTYCYCHVCAFHEPSLVKRNICCSHHLCLYF